MTDLRGFRGRYFFSFFLLISLTCFQVSASSPSFKWITIDENSLDLTDKSIGSSFEEYKTVGGVSLIKIEKDAIQHLSSLMHVNFNRCGGYFLHDNLEEGKKFLKLREKYSLIEKTNFENYIISEQEIIRPMIEQVNERKILYDHFRLGFLFGDPSGFLKVPSDKW